MSFIKHYAFVGSFLFFADSGFAQDNFTDAISLAAGSWGVNESLSRDDNSKSFRSCGSTPVIITIDRKNMRYKADHSGEDFIVEGDILKVMPRYLSVRYDDEDRLMKNGQAHIWHMVFVEDNKFYWVLGPGVSKGERDGVVDVPRYRCKLAIS